MTAHTVRSGWVVVGLGVLLAAIVASPLSRSLLTASGGSVGPAPYSSLALTASELADGPVRIGLPVYVVVTNATGAGHTYQWAASQNAVQLAQGSVVVPPGASVVVDVPTTGAVAGRLAVAILGTDIRVSTLVRAATPGGPS